MNWVKDKYQALPSKERKQLWALVVCSLMAAYFFYAAALWEQMFHTQKMANRKADRIEKRIGNIQPPEIEEGITEAALKRLGEKMLLQESQLKGFADSLLPAFDSEAREELKLRITQHANVNQLRISSLKSVGFDQRKQNGELTNSSLRSQLYTRPSFKLVLSGQFLNLLGFVEGLNQLPYQVYVSELSISRLSKKNSLLKIEMELKL